MSSNKVVNRRNTISLGDDNAFLSGMYRISSVIRWSFFFQNNPKNLDLSYKMDLDLWDCLGRVKLVL